MMDAAATETWR